MRSGDATASFQPILPHTRPRAFRSRPAIRPRRGPLTALATRTTFVINELQTAGRLWRNRGAFRPESRLVEVAAEMLRKSNNFAVRGAIKCAPDARARR